MNKEWLRHYGFMQKRIEHSLVEKALIAKSQTRCEKLAMNINRLSETELTEILKIAQDGETKFREMSDHATMIAEKWRVKTQALEKNASKSQQF